jgi:sensor domain CHASE-containing protein
MPRFFFNHRSKDGQHDVDIDGLKLPSLNSALEEASFAAQGAMALANTPTAGVFEIEDGGRVLVARVPYAVTADECLAPPEPDEPPQD